MQNYNINTSILVKLYWVFKKKRDLISVIKIIFILISLLLILSCEHSDSTVWKGDVYKLQGDWKGYTSDLDNLEFTVEMLSDSTLIINNFKSITYHNHDNTFEYQVEYDHDKFVDTYSDFLGVKVTNMSFFFNERFVDFPNEPYNFSGIFIDSNMVKGSLNIKHNFLEIYLSIEFQCYKVEN